MAPSGGVPAVADSSDADVPALGATTTPVDGSLNMSNEPSPPHAPEPPLPTCGHELPPDPPDCPLHASLGGGGGDGKESTNTQVEESSDAQNIIARDQCRHMETMQKMQQAITSLQKQKSELLTRVATLRAKIDNKVATLDQDTVQDLNDEMREHAKDAERLGMPARARSSKIHGGGDLKSTLWETVERRSLLTQINLLTAEIQDSKAAEYIASVQPIINKHCKPSELMQLNIEHSQATSTDEGIRQDALYARLDFDRHEEPTEDSLEPLFIADRLTESKRYKNKYQATAADLRLRNEAGDEAEAKGSIVDSGAARCAMNYAHFRQWFPTTKLRPTTKAFKDASGNRMNIAGEVDLGFWIGDLLLWTTVYVFWNLGHSFLLGVNAIHDNGLTISSVQGKLYSELPEATPQSHVPLTMMACAVCEDTQPRPPLASVSNCECNHRQLHCNKDDLCLTVSNHGKMMSSKTKCYRSTIDAKESPKEQVTEVRFPFKTTIKPGEVVTVPLEYGKLHKGDETTAEVAVDNIFLSEHPQLAVMELTYHSTLNLHANIRMKNRSSEKVSIPPHALFGWATYHSGRMRPQHRSAHDVINIIREAPPPTPTTAAQDEGSTQQGDQPVSPVPTDMDSSTHCFKVITVDRASGKQWHCIGDEAPGRDVEFADGVKRLHHFQELVLPALAQKLPQQLSFTDEELEKLVGKKQLLLTHYVIGGDGRYYAPLNSLPFEEGGRPRTIADLKEIGFSLDKAIDPSQPRRADGSYPPLAEELKQELYDVALEFWYVWSRDARAPEISRLVVIEIPTGSAQPIAQKPYPIPYAYLEAARDELQKLLDAGLIEPCISNWASPVLVRLKKDSTPEKIRLKLICDFRRLNEVTVPDAAGLGDQEEILDGFGGDQRWSGIVDAAGGFYQLLISPKDRYKTAICLPTSMGGTQFQWRVAPYGLTRNPAGYSRGMMFALKGLNSCSLDGGHARGGAASWIDDISMHANSFAGFKDLFRRILTRLAFAGMSLKASKCFLLHHHLEVLGFYVTPDGIIMQPEALERIEKCGRTIERRDDNGKMIGPRSVKEIRTFLGAVQFYRRFVPRIALLAAPMNGMLKKMDANDPRLKEGTAEHTQAWDGVQQSFEAIMLFLRSSAVVSAPDLSDPRAEYVIVCDACDIAAGGALLQWQYPGGNGPGPPAGTPLRGGTGPDPITQSWRIAAGWKLRTIGYFHKTFSSAQINYPTFDQEGAAILTCCRRWAKLITGRPTTLYTDSAVAATMLTKHMGTLRLATWGIELGTFLPYLKIQHRKGVQNGLADFISRYPTFQRYVKRPRDELQLPPGVFDNVASVPLFTHEVADEEERRLLSGFKVDLVETSNVTEAEKFWNKPENLAAVTAVLEECQDPDSIMDQLHVMKESLSQESFWQEQKEFEEYAHDWNIYSDIFQSTHGRRPVLWDLCCGEGGYSRGAQFSGFDCYGFDSNPACKHRYESDLAGKGPENATGMTFHTADVLTDEFWEKLTDTGGELGNIPRPDVIHASPDCRPYSRLRTLAVGGSPPDGSSGPDDDSLGSTAAKLADTWTIDYLLRKLKGYERWCATQHGRHVLWQIENVPDSAPHVTERFDHKVLLCGTMMGHQTFRHRLFYCNYPVATGNACRHEGKYVGSRGVRFHAAHNHERFGHIPEPNMYGVYGRPYEARGHADDWHGAMGHNPGTFSALGLRGVLPVGFGRLLSSQALAHSLNRQFACPVIPPGERQAHETDALELWACTGYKPLSSLSFLGVVEPNAEERPSVLEAMWPDTDCLNEQICNLMSASAQLTKTLGQLPGKDKMPSEPQYLDVPTENDSPYVITAADQRSDPVISGILDSLQDKTGKGTASRLWHVQDGKLYRRGFDSSGEPSLQIYVPMNRRSQILGQLHYTDHRGHRPLHKELLKNYYWPEMLGDCVTFTATCDVCAPLAARPLDKVPTNPIPTPSRPFTVLHVDHADFRGRPSGPRKYLYMLIVTCALTRFTIFIPVTDSTAEVTLKELNRCVFCIFGPPLIMVSDNGPAFISDLSKACSKLWGYRHIHILPYNSQANGVAESSVKRIKLLLDRHCQGHRNWHTLVPVLQLRLNADVHSGIGVSPYVAVFGREPVGLAQLEDPSLYPETSDGDGFLHELRARLVASNATLRAHSDALKEAHAREQNARRLALKNPARHGILEASRPDDPKYAWLLHGSKEQAAYLAKHGHGLPWKHKYKVLELRPHAVRLEVPTDGSVPRVNEWQLRRRVARAPAHSHGPGDDAPIITEAGLLIPGEIAAPRVDPLGGDPYSGDETEYKIDCVKYAEKVGRYYKIWLKWVGHEELSWRWRHELVTETTNAELLKEIEDAVTAERDRIKATRKDAYSEQEEELEAEPPPAQEEQPDEPLGRGAPRQRRAPDRYVALVMDDDSLEVLYNYAVRHLHAHVEWFAPSYAVF